MINLYSCCLEWKEGYKEVAQCLIKVNTIRKNNHDDEDENDDNNDDENNDNEDDTNDNEDNTNDNEDDTDND